MLSFLEKNQPNMAESLSKAMLRSDRLPGALTACHHHGVSVFSPAICSLKSMASSSESLKLIAQPPLKFGDFTGGRIGLRQGKVSPIRPIYGSLASMTPQTGFRIGKAQKWWEKGLQPNMKEVSSAQDLVDSLSNAGDVLVVVDFFSPGCGGCKALHPKICQIAEMNPDVQFLQINYEEHKSMCYSLNVHVLPFFRFYRGAHGRLCSFSCTNATIKKFKDALSKHKTDRCSLGPTKGLEEKELMALAANKELSFNYTPPDRVMEEEEAILAEAPSLSLPNVASSIPAQDSNEAYVHAWR